MKRFKRIMKGHAIAVKDDDIVNVCLHTPNLTHDNYKKMEKAYEKGKGCRIKLSEEERVGCGLGDIAHEVKKDVQKVGKVAMKTGIVDLAIDEGVNFLPAPAIAKKVASKALKYEVHHLTGTGINPYMPMQLQGSGFNLTETPKSTQLSYLSNHSKGSELTNISTPNHYSTQLSYLSNRTVGKKY